MSHQISGHTKFLAHHMIWCDSHTGVPTFWCGWCAMPELGVPFWCARLSDLVCACMCGSNNSVSQWCVTRSNRRPCSLASPAPDASTKKGLATVEEFNYVVTKNWARLELLRGRFAAQSLSACYVNVGVVLWYEWVDFVAVSSHTFFI